MNASIQRAGAGEPPPPQSISPVPGPVELPPAFDAVEWNAVREEQGGANANGRAMLGAALLLLAALWLGYTGWAAGRSLAGLPLSSPALAQWLSIAAGPLALLGLLWLMFGRTRRREAEAFTRQVVAMRTEARSLEAVLDMLGARIGESHRALGAMTGELMRLGDEAGQRLSAVTRDLQSGSAELARHGHALDTAAESARNDLAAMLDDLPRLEAAARTVGDQLRGAGRDAAEGSIALDQRLEAITRRSDQARSAIEQLGEVLARRSDEVERAGQLAREAIEQATASGGERVDALLDRASQALLEIRGGIDEQSAAVTALVEQASVALGRTGSQATDLLSGRLLEADRILTDLGARLAEQDRSAQRLVADLDLGVRSLDERFGALRSNSDQHSAAITAALGRLRGEIDALAHGIAGNDAAVAALGQRADTLRGGIDVLGATLRGELAEALAAAESGAVRLLGAARDAMPEVEWMRDASVEAASRIGECAAGIDQQQDRLAALLSALDEGVARSQASLADLSDAIDAADGNARHLHGETGPALIAALLQVRETAAHAAERAREAIHAVIPQAAASLGDQARRSLEQAVRDGVADQLREVETAAARAVEAARIASRQLAQQMLGIGQSAAALEAHATRIEADRRQADSEAFARRVSLLIDSMHSASIDVGKILSDEIDDKAWAAYLRGDRGVFTRRAVRLIGGGESRALQAHYDSDAEFQQSVNRFVHDFEAMLRRVLAESDGALIAVTLLSSDVGKLYAALGQAIDRRR